MKSPDSFTVEFINIPTLNLRMEFNSTYAFLQSYEAELALAPPIEPIRLRWITWGGMPDDFFTLILQRAILGLESYLPCALTETSVHVGSLNSELMDKLRNPFSFGSKSAAANIFHRMPSAVHPSLSLKVHDPALYDQNVEFYQKVRNPLFHGQQLSKPTIEQIRSLFLHLARVYEWIDCWYDPEYLWPGGRTFAGVHKRYLPQQKTKSQD